MVRVFSTEIPMTPTDSIAWECTDTDIGRLYLPPGSENRETAELLQSGSVGDLIASGKSGGNVHQAPAGADPDLVVKEFTPRIVCNEDIADRGDLASLRVNVMLASGLSMLEQQRGAWRIEGASILGALVMHGDIEESSVHARWVMKRIFPQEDIYASQFMPMPKQQMMVGRSGAYIKYGRTVQPERKPSLPSPKRRQKLYDQAITLANGGIEASGLVVGYDDHPGNMLLENLPVIRGRKVLKQGTAIKLDVQPLKGFDF